MFLVFKNYTTCFFGSVYSFIGSTWLFKKCSNNFFIVIFLDLCTRVHCCVTTHSFVPLGWTSASSCGWLQTKIHPFTGRPSFSYYNASINSSYFEMISLFLIVRGMNTSTIQSISNQTRYLQASLYKRGRIVQCWHQCRSYLCTSV